jgi:hypothetical protein
MKHTNRYVYVMTLGMASGVGFVNAYEIEDLNVRADADLPEPELLEARRERSTSNWTKTAVRLSEAFRRVVRQPLWRKALKPGAAA